MNVINTLQQIFHTLGILHVISHTFKKNMRNIEEWKLVFGEAFQTTLQIVIEVFICFG
jgi:hypothetical protein